MSTQIQPFSALDYKYIRKLKLIRDEVEDLIFDLESYIIQETKSEDKVSFDTHNDNLAHEKSDSSPDTFNSFMKDNINKTFSSQKGRKM